jgi:hypothetical protein
MPPPGPHRWSHARATLRLIPDDDAPRHTVTLWMGVPFPSTLGRAHVRVRAGSEEAVTFEVDDQVRPYTLQARTPAGAALEIRLHAPTWSRLGEPAEQGVRVDRVTLAPAPRGLLRGGGSC